MVDNKKPIKEKIMALSKEDIIPLNTGLSDAPRAKVAEKLKVVLADHYLLMLKTHNYHWNVRGPLFKSVHDLTEEQYENLFAAIDELAERIRALGKLAPGSFALYQELSAIKEGRVDLSAEDMIADLLQSQELVIKNIRQAAKTAEEAEDEVSADLLTERLANLEKFAWMLRSFLEK